MAILKGEILVEPTKQLMKSVIADFFYRVLLPDPKHTQTTRDLLIDCPRCGQPRSIIKTSRGWRCLGANCGFQFPPELEPPDVSELIRVAKDRKIAKMLGELCPKLLG